MEGFGFCGPALPAAQNRPGPKFSPFYKGRGEGSANSPSDPGGDAPGKEAPGQSAPCDSSQGSFSLSFSGIFGIFGAGKHFFPPAPAKAPKGPLHPPGPTNPDPPPRKDSLADRPKAAVAGFSNRPFRNHRIPLPVPTVGNNALGAPVFRAKPARLVPEIA